MKTKVSYLLTLMFFAGVCYAQNGTQLLDKAAGMFSGVDGVLVTFTGVMEQGGTSETFDGSLQIKGDKFVLETPDMKTWFDGKTQWIYIERNEEVNVSNPSGDELRFTNPTILFSEYKKDFQAVNKGEGKSKTGKSIQLFELTPKAKNEITRVDLQVEKASGSPVEIVLYTRNNMVSTIHITGIKSGQNHSDSTFVFSPKDYPDAEIIDLR